MTVVPQEQQQHTAAENQRHERHTKQQQYTEVDSALDHIGVGTFHVLLLLCISLVWAGDAAEVMVLSYLGPAASCNFGFDSPTSQSLLTSVVFAGMLLGSASWGFLADELGRKRALLTSAAVVVAAGLASGAAPTPALLLLSRAVVGFGLAGAPVAFTLMMELLPANSRALWGVLIELAWTVGTVAEAGLAWAVLNSQGWRWLLLLSTVPLAVLLVLVRQLVESPRFLVARGDAAGAAAVLQQMAAINGKTLPALPYLTGLQDTAAPHAGEVATSTAAAAAEEGTGQAGRRRHRPLLPPEGPAAETTALLPHGSGSIDLAAFDSSHPQPALQQRPHSSHQPQQHLLPKVSAAPASHQQHSTAVTSWTIGRTIQTILSEARNAVCTLWAGQYACTTSLLAFSWAAVACGYYGLVQLDGQMHVQAGAGGSSGAACVAGMLQVPSSDYAAVMITAAAEVPAVAWAAGMTKGFGGSTALVSSLVLGCVCLLPGMAAAALHGGDEGSWATVSEVSMFGSRLFVSAAFSLLWVFTPSHFPTRVRGLGLGISNAFGRVGGLLSPFIAINLAIKGGPAAAQGMLSVLCLLAAGAAIYTPHGHTTQEQQLEEDEDE